MMFQRDSSHGLVMHQDRQEHFWDITPRNAKAILQNTSELPSSWEGLDAGHAFCSSKATSLIFVLPKYSSPYAIGTARSLGLSGKSFTVTAWVNLESFDNIHGQDDHTIIGMDDYGFGVGLHLIIRNGFPYMGFYGNDTASPQPLTLNQWHHIAFVYDLNERSQAIYIDGKLSVKERNHDPLGGDNMVYLSRYAGGRGLDGR